MAHGVGKHQLLEIGPAEPWSVREKLCLATSVMKSGDKNWVSVSRAIKPFAEPGRPPDWFSHKHCASKYSELLETAEAPKQKRGAGGEVVETARDVMVRRLTANRVDALRELIKETQEKHRKLKREAELIQAGRLDSKLEELWGDILQKKKLEEKEAELKRKNTNAAYKARRVAKSTPKPEPGIPVHPPSGCSAPGQVFSPGDPPECLTLDLALTKNPSGSARLAAMAESSGPGNVGPGSLLDDPAQRKLLSQKATAPPSPLLSELLKQGSILATHSRLIGEGDVTTANVTGAHDLQLAPPRQPLTQATERPLPPGCRPVDGEDKVAALGQGDATVSYVGDGLDLKTVGDIIAIIKGETDVTSEALDAQSLCEENGRALSGAGGPGPFHPRGSVPTGVQQASSPHSSPQGKTEVLEAHGATPASPSSLCISRKRGLAAFPMGPGGLPRTPSSWKSSHQHRAGAPPQPQAMRGAGVLARQKSRISSDVTLKRESGPGPPRDDSVAEDGPLTARSPKGTTAVTEARGGGEADGAEGCSPGLSDSEDSCSLHAASSSTPRLHAAPDSAPSSPASSQFSVCSDDHESLQAHKMWKKAIMLVWRAAANHRYANVFLQPVTDDIAPGYHGIVQRPVDLAAIKKSIEAGLIRNTAEFQRDIMLMFQNAVMYNSLDHDVNHMALEMQRDVLEQIQQFLATQLIVETSESGTSGKSLRGRESSRKQDAPDEVLH